jgi:DNA-directed RNA polymerase specialized sigma24 family protein
MMARARQAVPAREDDALTQLYRHVTEQQAARFGAEYDLAAGRARYSSWLRDEAAGAGAGDADQAVTALYRQHYRTLVRLAVFLVGDVTAAERLVQDSFVALHPAWPGLRGRDHAAAFLQRSVIQGSRAPRHLAAMAQLQAAGGHPGESAVVTALRALPARQREAVVLQCYADLTDGQIAAAMGVSTARARSHLAKAMAALRAGLQPDGGSLKIWQGEPS